MQKIRAVNRSGGKMKGKKRYGFLIWTVLLFGFGLCGVSPYAAADGEIGVASTGQEPGLEVDSVNEFSHQGADQVNDDSLDTLINSAASVPADEEIRAEKIRSSAEIRNGGVNTDEPPLPGDAVNIAGVNNPVNTSVNNSADTAADDAGQELVDAALGGLEGTLELFRNHPATEKWTTDAEQLIEQILLHLESDPDTAVASLEELTQLILRDEKLTETLLYHDGGTIPAENQRELLLYQAEVKEKYGSAESAAEKITAPASSAEPETNGSSPSAVRGPRELSQYSPQDRLELFRTFRYQLDRRVYLWTFAAEYFHAVRNGEMVPGRDLTPAEIASLTEKTIAVRNFFGISDLGKKWRNGFEVDALLDSLTCLQKLSERTSAFRPAFSPDAAGSVDTINPNEEIAAEQRYLRDRINSIQTKIQTTSMSAEQRKIFQNPVIASWVETLTVYHCDQGDAHDLLLAFEEYERTSGGEAGRKLARSAARLKASKSPAAQSLGGAIGTIFDNPNLKVYLSELFLNRFLPIRDPEFDVVQETVLNNPVAGRRRTDTQVKLKLLPDKDRLLLNLYVSGKIVADTRSDVFPAQVFNQSMATYLGRKTIEWKGDRIAWSDSEVAVNNSSRLSDVRTDIDFVPLIGELAREVVRGQYQSKQGQIDQATREKIIREVKSRIDTETTERFTAVNDRMAKNFFKPLADRGLTLKLKNSKTTDDWLLASLRLGEPYSLGSQTREPETVFGAFADFKVHESAVDTALSRLELAGKVFTIPELLEHLANVLQQPAIAQREIEDPGLVFGMASEDPVCISFHENRIQIRLRFDFIELNDREWEDVEAIISYQPSIDSEGNASLIRDGLISVDGPLSIRAQIPLRLIFAKAFPASGRFPLKPKRFIEDERFAGLSIGLCRVTEGWFAVSVIQETNKQARKPEGKDLVR